MKIVVIGGGTGTSTVLAGLKDYEDLFVTAVVTMMDDGGSNAVVRDEFGLLPLSDARKSILALSTSKSSPTLRKLFMYRFDKGEGLNGHTLGNLIMIALSEITGSEKSAIEVSSEMFKVRGKILPVTNQHVRLIARYNDGKKVVGEHKIDESSNISGIKKLKLSSNVKADPEVLKSILDAQYIVIGPGDIYTTILPNLLVHGVAKSIQQSKAKLVYISNLMSKKGETRGMTHLDLLIEIEKYLGKYVDYVLVNKSKLPTALLKKYEDDGEYPFRDNLSRKNLAPRHILKADLISESEVIKEKGDTIKRSLIRHDPDKLASELYHIFRGPLFNYFSNLISKY